MPLIQVQHLAGAFTPAEQETLIRELTDVFVRLSGERIRPNVLITISEVRSGLWATGGTPLTIEDVERRKATRAAAEKN